MLHIIGRILISLLALYQFILLLRVIFDWIPIFSRTWRPRGALLVLANVVFALTDKPVGWFSKLIPPLRVGGVALDIGFLILFFGISIVMRFIAMFT